MMGKVNEKTIVVWLLRYYWAVFLFLATILASATLIVSEQIVRLYIVFPLEQGW
jgi:hypothetical protein